MSKKPDTISTEVLAQIKSGEVRMRPRIYFTLLSSLIIIVSTIAGLTIAYLSSIIFYWFKVMNSSGMAYGARKNLAEAIASFPWWSIISIVILGVITTCLIKKYGNLYRHKTSTILFFILFISMLVGFGFSSFGIGTPNHTGANQKSEVHQGPPWYR